MSNFARALRLTFQYRFNVIACLASGLIVALLWGGNLTAIYPIIDVVMTDRALPQWVDDQLAEHTAKVRELNEKKTLLESQLDEAPQAQDRQAIQAELDDVSFMLRVHEVRVKWYRWASKPAHRYLPSTPFETLLVVCGYVLVGTMLKCGFRILHTVLSARLGYQVGFDLRREFYRQMLRLDMKNFSEQGRGDLMNRCTTDLNGVSAAVQMLVGQGLLEPLKMIVCFVIAALVSWRLLLLTMIITPLAGFTIYWLAKALKRAHRRAMQELSAIYETLTETLGAIKLIKAFTMESAERARFRQSAKLYYFRQIKIATYHSLVSPLTEFLGVLMILLASVMGGYLVLNRQTHLLGVIKISDLPLTHGSMSVFFAMMAGMADPARRLANVFNFLQQGVAASDRVYAVLDREPGIADPPVPQPLPKLTEAIHFNDVTFHYTPDKTVLQNIELRVSAGETIAIVGPNGCGKSTLLHLLPRFYDPVLGSVSIDGVDLRSVRVRDLRSRIGIVSQETLLLNDTVEANIAYGSPEASRAAIEAAARKAHAHSFILEKLSNGYETLVGPGGNRLSGGQRQRIALARAILRDPEILILDEATSQIDLESEQLIHQVLLEFLRDRTALVITHRMSTIALAERVVVMDKGTILDVGTHEELYPRCDLYRRLANLDYRESA